MLAETSTAFVDPLEQPTKAPTTATASKTRQDLNVFIFLLITTDLFPVSLERPSESQGPRVRLRPLRSNARRHEVSRLHRLIRRLISRSLRCKSQMTWQFLFAATGASQNIFILHHRAGTAVEVELPGSSCFTRSEEHTSELQSLRHLVC